MEVTKTETIEIKETAQSLINTEQAESDKAEDHNSSQLNGDSYLTADSSNSTHAQETKDTDFMDVDEQIVLIPQIQVTSVETTQQSSNVQPEKESNKSSPSSGPSTGPKGGVLDISQFKSISRPKSSNGCTIPKSPYFATNHRFRSRNPSIDEQNQAQRQQKTNPGINKSIDAPKKATATKPMSPKFSKLHNKSRSISQTRLSPKALRNMYTFKNPKYQNKNPVKFKEFRFLTDKPRSNKGDDSPQDKPHKKHFARIPKFPPPVPFRPGQVPTTVPKPFHFASDVRFGTTHGRFEGDESSEGSRKHLRTNQSSTH